MTRKQWLLIGGGVVVVGGVVIYAATRPAPTAAPATATTPAPQMSPAVAAHIAQAQAIRAAQLQDQQAQAAAAQAAAQAQAAQAAQFAAAEAASNAASNAAGQPTPAPSGVTFAIVVNGNKSVQLQIGQTLGLQFLPCVGNWSQSSTQQPASSGNTVVQVMAPNVLLATTEGQADFTFRCADGQAYNVHVEVISPTTGRLQG